MHESHELTRLELGKGEVRDGRGVAAAVVAVRVVGEQRLLHHAAGAGRGGGGCRWGVSFARFLELALKPWILIHTKP